MNLLDHVFYPSSNQDISRNMEFIELSSTIPNFHRPAYIEKDYDPVFLHQPVALRLALQQDRLLVIYPPGSGKTCTAVNIPEYLKRYGSLVGKSHIKRVYILQRGPSVIADVKNQIVNVCAREIYGFEETGSQRSNKRKTTNVLSSFYTIQTYNSFSGHQVPDHLMEETYSDSVFIIDEAHNIIGWDGNKNEDADEESMSKKDIINAYNYIHRVVHCAKRSKVIIMTATPMINSTSEFGKLLNLLLPLDQQIPVSGPNSIDFDHISRQQFNFYTKGLITYVPNRQSSVVIKDVGSRIDVKINNMPSQYILCLTPMTGIQRQTYHRVLKNINSANFGFLEQRKVSDFVFPDGSYDGIPGVTNRGLYKYVNSPENDRFVPTESFKYEIRTNLQQLSSKFHYVLQKELNPDRVINIDGKRIELPGRGCSYYFFDLVAAHAIPFTMCLEAFGFERYNDGNSPFTTVGGVRSINIEKRPRYIFLTKDNVSTKLQNFKDLFNSEENVFGEYVQIIVGSRVIRDGINIFNVARIYIDPLWNPSNENQAMSRAKRLPGHRKVIEATRQIMKENGVSSKSIDEWKFVLEQHRMCSIDPNPVSTRMVPQNAVCSVIESIDKHMYIDIIEKKSLFINRIMEMAIDNAVDRYINKDPPQFELTQENVYYDTFDAVYSDRLIQQIKKDIFGVFFERYFYTFDEIRDKVFELLPPLLRREKYIYQALGEIVKDKTAIKDRYNIRSWIHVKGNYIFISSTYPDNEIGLLDAYYNNIVAVKNNSIKNDVKNYCLENVGKLLEVPFESNSNITNVVIVEYLVELLINKHQTKEYWSKSNSKLQNVLKRLLDNNLFVFWKPYTDLKQSSYLLSLPSVNKGVKASEDSKSKLKNMVYHPEPARNFLEISGEEIYLQLVVLHTLNNKIRLIESGSEWRDVKVYEEDVYQRLIEDRRQKIIQDIPINKLYGVIEIGGKFKIGTKDDNQDIDDKRLIAKGKACGSMKKEELLEMIKDEGGELTEIQQQEYNKIDLCEILMALLENKNRLIRL